MTWLLRINYFLFVYHFLVLSYIFLFRIDCTALVLLVCFVFSLLVFSFLNLGVELYLFSGILCGGWYVLCGLVMFCSVLVCMVRGLVSRWFCTDFLVFGVIQVWDSYFI